MTRDELVEILEIEAMQPVSEWPLDQDSLWMRYERPLLDLQYRLRQDAACEASVVPVPVPPPRTARKRRSYLGRGNADARPELARGRPPIAKLPPKAEPSGIPFERRPFDATAARMAAVEAV